MSPRALEPEYESGLVEAAVLAAMAARTTDARLGAARERLYEIADPEAREAAFTAFHARWFERLGLCRPFLDALAERAWIGARCGRWLVIRARAERDEAADLLATAGAPPTLVVRVTAETVAAPERLRQRLRRELLHVEDMLDPAFGYQPALPDDVAGTPEEWRIREGYRVLWDTWVDGRLARLGQAPAELRQVRFHEFASTFPGLGESAGAWFDRFFDAPALTHADLLAFTLRGPHSSR